MTDIERRSSTPGRRVSSYNQLFPTLKTGFLWIILLVLFNLIEYIIEYNIYILAF